MRIAAALLALTLLGCQSSNLPPATKVTTAATATGSDIPRRPLTRLNPRRQSLQVGEAPLRPRALPRKVGVRVVASPAKSPEPPPRLPRANSPQYYAPPMPQPARGLHPSLPTQGWPPPAPASLSQAERSRMQAEAFVAQEQERIRQNNEMLMNRPQPGGGLTPVMQRIAYPQVQTGPTEAHLTAERRYLEARADFLNTKYSPNGPQRYTPENVRGMVGTGMPLPPQMIGQPAIFNPVLQKAQQAEVLRQQMVATP